eukprot:m.219596 g.219596  ORF g.219596 m.219596 type:complete len:404 (-) comp30549_c0_seq1:157-1368(-)
MGAVKDTCVRPGVVVTTVLVLLLTLSGDVAGYQRRAVPPPNLSPQDLTNWIVKHQNHNRYIPPPPSRFKIIALATFPRSGTSWTLSLLWAAGGLRTGSEVGLLMKAPTIKSAWPSGLGQPPATVLDCIVRVHRATPTEASDEEILKFLKAYELVAPFTMKQVGTRLVQEGGVKEAHHGVMSKVCGANHSLDMNTLTLGHLPPIVIKSHFPTLLHDHKIVGRFLLDADVRLHTIRNPIDNIVSRFHGNPVTQEKRADTYRGHWWENLLTALQQGKTTPEFNWYVGDMSNQYIMHHTYWFNFAKKHGRTHPSVFVRYESMCNQLKTMLQQMLDQVNFVPDPERTACAIQTFPCECDNYPEHASFFNRPQRRRAIKVTQYVSDTAGYVWADNGSLAFKAAKIPMLH